MFRRLHGIGAHLSNGEGADMALDAKICGIGSPEAMDASLRHGARFVGLNFFPNSPRYVTFDAARALGARVPEGVGKVGVFVDPDDQTLHQAIESAGLAMVQLHGSEDPQRVADIRGRFAIETMKVIRVAGPDDLDAVADFEPVADWLMFDTKPPKGATRPGGNAVAFDWRVLVGRTWKRPWMLSGGLDAENVVKAATLTGARCVDVSSGVESAPGVKDPAMIKVFLKALEGH
jgi:phosphoribosylanthranilate isomerase